MNSVEFNPILIKSKLTKNQELGKDYFISWFQAPDLIPGINPGQFVMIESGSISYETF